MNRECNIVSDLIPLYAEDLVSEETASFVREHIAECNSCSEKLENAEKPVTVPKDITPLKRIKTKLFQRIVCVVCIVMALMLSAFAFLSSPQYFPYSKDLVSYVYVGDEIFLHFSDEVTAYSIEQIPFAEDYIVSAWTSTWDRVFFKKGTQILKVPKGSTVYYTSNNGTEFVRIAGEGAPVRGEILPRLVLGYYIIISFILILVLSILCCFRKFRKTSSTLLPIPVFYIISHLFTKGFTTTTYSLMHDFSLIVMITILLYIAFLLLKHVLKTK